MPLTSLDRLISIGAALAISATLVFASASPLPPLNAVMPAATIA